MNIHEIENLTYAELKERKDELAGALVGTNFGELAVRYVQARTDAKQRDEKLAEQGQTIQRLNELLDAKTLRVEELAALCEASENTIAECRTANLHLSHALEACQADRDDANARADRLKAEATRHATALHAAQKALADATALQDIENADTGD